jgi:CheY-like chemotaxis protein
LVEAIAERSRLGVVDVAAEVVVPQIALAKSSVGLPTQQPASAHRAALTSPTSLMKRILVVDDDAAIRSVISALLTTAGYEVITMEDGAGALKIAAHQSLSVAIVDVFMPGVDGLETIRGLTHLAPGMPLIMVSGFPFARADSRSPDFLGMSIKLGSAHHLAKPFKPSELLELVEACEGRSGAKNSAEEAA